MLAVHDREHTSIVVYIFFNFKYLYIVFSASFVLVILHPFLSRCVSFPLTNAIKQKTRREKISTLVESEANPKTHKTVGDISLPPTYGVVPIIAWRQTITIKRSNRMMIVWTWVHYFEDIPLFAPQHWWPGNILYVVKAETLWVYTTISKSQAFVCVCVRARHFLQTTAH